jgi:hypothetical protein
LPRNAATPVREYAARAQAGRETDLLRAVLADRLAPIVEAAVREYLGRPLSDLGWRERTLIANLAQRCAVQADDTYVHRPPTAGELARIEARKALASIQAQLRCDGNRLGHALDVFRPVPDRAGYVESVCRTCGAGVTVHTATAGVSPSEPFQAPCPGGVR